MLKAAYNAVRNYLPEMHHKNVTLIFLCVLEEQIVTFFSKLSFILINHLGNDRRN